VRVERAEFEAHVIERVPMTGHVGKSGATLERVAMDDGRRLVVKRLSPAHDLVMAASGDTVGREYVLWSSGLLDRLPVGIGHPVVAGWPETDGATLVMRDLGSTVLSWDDRLDPVQCRQMLERVARLHDAFADLDPGDVAPGALTDLGDLLGLFSPLRLAAFAGGENPLADIALHGWDVFFDVVPPGLAGPVSTLLDDMSPLVGALARCPCTLVHGDLATVNMALGPEQLTLIDWSMPAFAPGAVDIGRFLAGCSSVVDLSREEVIATYREVCASYDERAMHLALLTALLWLGWNKAMDATEHPDPAIRAREADDLQWWLTQARVTFDEGLL
jgi:hypothetical protein